MTGEELLRKLQAMSPEQLAAVVKTEGCDCDGYAGDVVHEQNAIEQALMPSKAVIDSYR